MRGIAPNLSAPPNHQGGASLDWAGPSDPLRGQMTGTRGQLTGMRRQTAGMGGQTPGMGDQMPGIRRQTMGMGGQMTGTRGQMTGMGDQMPGMRRQKAGTRGQGTGRGDQMTGMRRQKAGIGGQMAGTRGQGTGRGDQMTGMRRQKAGIGGQSAGIGGQSAGIGRQTTGMGRHFIGMTRQSIGMTYQSIGRRDGRPVMPRSVVRQIPLNKTQRAPGLSDRCRYRGSGGEPYEAAMRVTVTELVGDEVGLDTMPSDSVCTTRTFAPADTSSRCTWCQSPHLSEGDSEALKRYEPRHSRARICRNRHELSWRAPRRCDSLAGMLDHMISSFLIHFVPDTAAVVSLLNLVG